jgi:tetratricopeptide (TPR) repeat protein
MKRGLIHVGAMVLAFVASPVVMTGPAGAVVQAGDANREALAVAVEAVTSVNMLRVSEDATYAEEMLGHLDLVEPLATTAGARLELDDIRMVALASLRRAEDLGPVFDRIMDQRPRDPHQYGRAWWAALVVNDADRVVAVVEHASRNIPASGWSELRHMFDRDVILPLMRQLRTRGDDAGRTRLAAALFRIGWPGPSERGLTDFLRTILIDDHLRRGQVAAAADYAAGLVSPDLVAELIVQRRYDPLFPDDADRLARLEAAIALDNRNTSADLADNPGNMRRVLDRTQHLRTLGRDADALELLRPHMRDVAATVRADETGLWLINEAAYALLALGQGDDGADLMGRLAALSIDEQPELISTSINHGAVLWRVGRYEEALAHTQRLERDFSHYASEYGKMWMRANIVCSLAALGRSDEAEPVLDAMRAAAEENEASLSRAYLCLDDLDAVEELMIRRLAADNPGQAVLALQDYSLASEASVPDPVFDRLMSLRERPAVREALERVGRVLRLPVARTYWGGV